VWRDHAPHRQGIRFGKVLIAGQYYGIIFQGDEPEYPPEQVEILSDQHLRTALGLRDGDLLEFTLLTDLGTDRMP
jgi:CTP-dependent riboflavin kinase